MTRVYWYWMSGIARIYTIGLIFGWKICLPTGCWKRREKHWSSAPNGTALQAIGYKELSPYFQGDLSLPEAKEILKRQTRRYAKRQLTWFHRMAGAHFLYIDDYENQEALYRAALHAFQTHYNMNGQETGEREHG